MWLDIFGLSRSEREESFKMALDLARPAPGEDENLALHSEICARRFRALVDLLKAQYDQSRANKALIFVVIALHWHQARHRRRNRHGGEGNSLTGRNKNFVLSLIRHAATFAGGLLVAKGFADASQVETLVSGVVTAAGIFWSLWHHTPDAPPRVQSTRVSSPN